LGSYGEQSKIKDKLNTESLLVFTIKIEGLTKLFLNLLNPFLFVLLEKLEKSGKIIIGGDLRFELC
jgi:hypothetical protein